MDFKDLTEEQRAKARACKTSDELVELARKEGVELPAACGEVQHPLAAAVAIPRKCSYELAIPGATPRER